LLKLGDAAIYFISFFFSFLLFLFLFFFFYFFILFFDTRKDIYLWFDTWYPDRVLYGKYGHRVIYDAHSKLETYLDSVIKRWSMELEACLF